MEPITIAIAEDHTILRKSLIAVLDLFDGFDVVADAANGKELLAQMEQKERLPQVCLLDISMPIMDGYATLRFIKKEWPGIKVLILSQHNTEFHILRMVQHGANGYLVKNCEPEELVQAIMLIRDGYPHFPAFVPLKTIREMTRNNISRPVLSDRELEFINLCCSEMTYNEIAELMFISKKTVEHYQSSLFKKLNVTSRVGLVICALQCGIISLV
jgi:DNA-binding NarL/FixJ family response regulator